MIEAYALLVIFTMFGSTGGFFLKRATTGSARLTQLLTSTSLYIGLFFYLISAGLNIVVLQMLPYSVVLPCSAITYVWSLGLGHKFLGERVSMLKLAGVGLILVGTVLIATG